MSAYFTTHSNDTFSFQLDPHFSTVQDEIKGRKILKNLGISTGLALYLAEKVPPWPMKHPHSAM